MRHQKHRYKLGVQPSHRKAMIKNLACSVIEHGRIKSTHTKCMAVRGYVEKLITLAKEDTVANRRLAFSRLNSKKAVQRLFSEVAPKHKDRAGGYTRVLKLSDSRVGDNAPMSLIAFVD